MTAIEAKNRSQNNRSEAFSQEMKEIYSQINEAALNGVRRVQSIGLKDYEIIKQLTEDGYSVKNDTYFVCAFIEW